MEEKHPQQTKKIRLPAARSAVQAYRLSAQPHPTSHTPTALSTSDPLGMYTGIVPNADGIDQAERPTQDQDDL